MSTSNDTGAVLGVALWIITVTISIISGILTWKWIDPGSFWRAILFIIIWGFLSKVGHLIGVGLITLLSERI